MLVIVNPNSGSADPSAVSRALDRHLGGADVSYRVHRLAKGEEIADVVRDGVKDGIEVVVAAGGDGTVSGVADVLAETDIQIGIIPAGTGNTLARELGIPLAIDDAVRLLGDRRSTVQMDAGRVGDRVSVLDVGVGVSAFMMDRTDRRQKHRFGMGAYMWNGLKGLVGIQPHRFTLTVDGKQYSRRASEISVANSGAIGEPALRWGPDVDVQDGKLDVCVVRARTVWEFARLFWHVLSRQQRRDPDIECLKAAQRIVIESRRAMPVQIDGESAGTTPVRIDVLPGALQVICGPESDRSGVPETE
jgi:YegS/Rv2252/BmrU family lipid kinase